MTDVFMSCVHRVLRLRFHKNCRCTTESSLEAALFTGLSLVGLCLIQVRSQEIVLQPSHPGLDSMVIHAIAEKTLPVGEGRAQHLFMQQDLDQGQAKKSIRGQRSNWRDTLECGHGWDGAHAVASRTEA